MKSETVLLMKVSRQGERRSNTYLQATTDSDREPKSYPPSYETVMESVGDRRAATTRRVLGNCMFIGLRVVKGNSCLGL